MKSVTMAVLSFQGISFILGIVVLVVLLYLRFYKEATTHLKDSKEGESKNKS